MDSGLSVDRTEAERTLLSEALKRYRRDIVPTKRHPYQENRRIDRWLKNDLVYRTLANLRGADFARYRDARREDGRAENTIRLELQIISHLYEIARKEWGMEGLINPLDNIRKPGGSRARDRRLLPGEYGLIHASLTIHSNCFALPAFNLAIETSLRQGTLFKLQWEWIDFSSCMIRLPTEARGPENKGIAPAIASRLRTVCASSNSFSWTLRAILRVDVFGQHRCFMGHAAQSDWLALYITPAAICQGTLFAPEAHVRHASAVMAALDGLNARYGQDTVWLGAGGMACSGQMRAANKKDAMLLRQGADVLPSQRCADGRYKANHFQPMRTAACATIKLVKPLHCSTLTCFMDLSGTADVDHFETHAFIPCLICSPLCKK
jgi:hypothetical protein